MKYNKHDKDIYFPRQEKNILYRELKISETSSIGQFDLIKVNEIH